jgi:hypothetical protein
MGDKRSSAERTAAVELSKGMLDIIGAYGVCAAGDVRADDAKACSPPPERILASADGGTSEGVRPRSATG